jgi:hypothetical protein
MNFFSSLYLGKSSREQGGSCHAFFVQLIIIFPIKLPKEEKKEVKQVFEKVEKLGPHIPYGPWLHFHKKTIHGSCIF